MLTIPTWGLWIMFASSIVGTILLGAQLRAIGLGLRKAKR